ncbi:DMT family transporter [Methylobacterium sp. A54F]
MSTPPKRFLPAASTRGLITGLSPPVFVLIWATGFLAARYVAPYADPLTFVALRVTGVALVLAAIAVLLGARWPRTVRSYRDAMVGGVLMQGVYVLGVFWAVHRGLPAGIAALIGSLQPLVTAMLARPLLGEIVSRRRWLGIALGFLGAALVLAPKVGAAGASAIPPAALGMCVVAMLAMTLGTLWQKRTAGEADLLTNATVQFAAAALLAIPIALLLEDGHVVPSPQLWIGMAWSILVNSVAGILLLLVLIRRGAVAGVASLFFLVPPVAAALAYLLFGEALIPIQIAGMLVAAAGVAVANRG